MTADAILTSRNATLPDMVAILRSQWARRLDVVASAAAIHAHEGNLVIIGNHIAIWLNDTPPAIATNGTGQTDSDPDAQSSARRYRTRPRPPIARYTLDT